MDKDFYYEINALNSWKLKYYITVYLNCDRLSQALHLFQTPLIHYILFIK